METENLGLGPEVYVFIFFLNIVVHGGWVEGWLMMVIDCNGVVVKYCRKNTQAFQFTKQNHLGSSMVAVARSTILGYLTFFLSSSSCAHRMNLRR